LSDARHAFGGDWTEVKLAAISAYSQFFTRAIQNQFDLWYVDPFAGTGERTAVENSGGLFEAEPISQIEKQYPGSAARALSIEPPFAHLRFGDALQRHARALERLVGLFPNRDAKVVHDNANDFIQRMFSTGAWASSASGRGTPRALVFVDAYGMEVKWRTVEVLAACEKADVWFLANMKAATQQLARDGRKLNADKRRSLREYFGCDDWEERFYSKTESPDLLGLMEQSKRSASRSEIADFHRERLGSLFRYVSTPLSLAVGGLDDYFLLYCMSNNPSDKARALISRGAESVITKYRQASRHRSALQEGGQRPSY